jgi:intracellular sulfur oxidation DsrE/DsrF family protein
MEEKEMQSSMARRQFLTRMGMGAGVVGAGVVGAAVVGSPAVAQAADSSWQPAREAQDEWFNKIPGGHRFVFDTTTPEGMDLGLFFARNYFMANEESYGLKDSDLAVVLVARHKATPFAYNDAMWAKYGKYFSKMSGFVDPKTKQPPTVNVYATKAKGSAKEPLINVLVGKGAHFGVCQMATHFLSGMIAQATDRKLEAVYKELTSNLVGNAHMVPAGIVAVNRAQEYGYSYVFTG